MTGSVPRGKDLSFPPHHTISRAHLASSPVDTGAPFPGWSMKLTTHIHLVPLDGA